MSDNPIVQSGDTVRFWVPETGLQAQTGTVESAEIQYGSTYAKIIPDSSSTPIYLFHRAVWGFEPMPEGEE